LRILVLTPYAFGDPVGRLGGVALYNREFLTALCAHPRVEEIVAIPRLMPGQPRDLPAGLTYVGSAANSKLKYVWGTIDLLLHDRRFDLIICTHINLLPLVFLARELIRKPVVLLMYGVDAWKAPRNPLLRALAARIDGLASIRDLTTDRYLAWSGAYQAVRFLLENPIRLECYGPGPKDPELLDRYGLRGRTVLLTVGRVEEPYKGFDETIEILPTLVKELANVSYLIVGDGPDAPRLRQKAKALRVADRVIFAGAVGHAEKTAHFRLGDVFLMPGRARDFDRYPLRFVFLEALACGVPCVASRPDTAAERASRAAELSIMVDPTDPGDVLAGIRTALGRGKGVVPPGLAEWSFERFSRRVREMVDRMTVPNA
jgi:phosphatidylinositol alpha-1,6-mannosyltransferase